MIVNRTLIAMLLLVALCFVILGAIFKVMPKKDDKEKELFNKDGSVKHKITSSAGIIERLNDSEKIQALGMRFTGKQNKELEILFRKAKNPWNMTPFTFNFIRYVCGIVPIVVGICLYQVNWTITLILVAIGGLCFVLPKKIYTDIAYQREIQWNQLYQYIWVIKNNLNYYGAKKTFIETENYIKDHSNNLPELVSGFHDFYQHWNGQYMDDYIKETYGDFSIPKQLFEIMLTSQLTGEYPDEELNSLRRVILEKMNFHVQNVLSTVGMKATMYSAPFLLMSVGLVVLVPVVLSIIEAFG